MQTLIDHDTFLRIQSRYEICQGCIDVGACPQRATDLKRCRSLREACIGVRIKYADGTWC